MRRYLIVMFVLAAVLSVAVLAQDEPMIVGADLLEDYPAVLFVTQMMAGNFDAVPALDVRHDYLATNFTFSEPGNEDGTMLTFMTDCHTWNRDVPDYAVEVIEVITGQDVVVVRYDVSGTHVTYGEFAYEPVVFFYMNGDLVQHVWMMYDRCQQGAGVCELAEAENPQCQIKQW